MIIHDVVQGTPEWDALRAAHDTASEASAMMGASKNTKRNELLHMKSTGSAKEFSDWVKKNLLDPGHEVEAAARPIIAKEIGERLFPDTATSDEEGYERLLASFDGVTVLEDTVWECKSWNEAKAAEVREDRVPEEDYWQVVQQLVVSRASRHIYTVTDGTPERSVSVETTLDPADEKRLIAGWKQFNEDRANYQHVEDKPEVVAEAVEDLPAVFVQVSGSLAVQDNFSTFEKALRFFLDEILIGDPQTDQDFADLDSQIKVMKKAESALDSAEQQMLAQVQEVNDLKRHKDMLHELVRKNRLVSEKLLSSQKEKIKLEIRKKGESAFATHIETINSTLTGGVKLPAIAANFAGAMKNKRTLASLRDAVDTELARVKIEANEQADKIRVNLDSLRELATDHAFLFRDRQELVLKDNETLVLLVNQRINDHKDEQERILEAERERIRKEEQDKLQKQAEEDARKLREETEAAEAAEQSQAAAEKSPEPEERKATPVADAPRLAQVAGTSGGKAPVLSERPSMIEKSAPRQLTPYQEGYLDGLAAFTHWKDGQQFVGTGGKTLAEAVDEFLSKVA